MPFDQVASLASRRSDALTSSFRPTYNMAANLVRRYTKFEAHHLLNLSFAQFHADRDVVALERQLERNRQQLARQRDLVGPDLDSLQEYRELVAELDSIPRDRASGGRRITDAMEALRPGDVVVVRRRGGRAGVLSHEHRRGGAAAWSRSRPGATSCGSARRTSTRRPGAPRPSTSRRRSRPATRRSGAPPPSGCGG